MANRNVARAVRMALIAASAASAGLYVPGAAAQDQEQELEQIVVTGSRIARQDFIANSPIQSVTQEQIVANADVTLDTYLNTLPQVNPSGGSTSNNPGNGGQANIDLRGLGSNRNIILIDGRRAMVSASDLTVDLNTIPAAMIESIEVITGGAGAAYGADAIAGAVNIRLKKNFEGVDLRGSYANTTAKGDAEEYVYSVTIGGKFNDGRGHALLGYEYSSREGVTKGQREFSRYATSVTTTPPQGVIRWGANAPTTAAVQDVFDGYGIDPALVRAESARIGFNRDGTLIFYGSPNNPDFDVQNFKDPMDVSVNANFYPDFYSYNFDAPNALVLPLERDSFMTDLSYELDSGVEFFGQVAWTQYVSYSGTLAPTPLPSVFTRAPVDATATQVASDLVVPGQTVSPAAGMVVPVTNPFIPADLLAILNSRTGDDARLVGSGATEPFFFGTRPLAFGARRAIVENTMTQWLGGARGPLFGLENWDWEVYTSEGRTEIDLTQAGNIDTQKVTDVLANPNFGGGACATWNPFAGSTPIPASCRTFLESPGSAVTEISQKVLQGFVRGDILELPAGTVSVVLGAEQRKFDYAFKFLSNPGPFSGFNTQPPDSGKNRFDDYFAEALIPILKDQPYAQSLDLSLGYRRSEASFTDRISGDSVDNRTSDAYKLEFSWAPLDSLRFRASYQEAVREPNFSELFSGGGSFPQYFDPCGVASAQRNGPDADAMRALCVATGVPEALVDSLALNPAGQLGIDLDGNTDLTPEEAETYTVGLVYLSNSDNQWLSRVRGSLDYYSIDISDSITGPTVNDVLADCYNYFGGNPTYDPDYISCQGISRAGGPLDEVINPNDPDGVYTFENTGGIQTSGIDLQLAYGLDLDWMGAPSNWGGLEFSLLLTHILEYKQDRGLGSVEYVGTIPYFGAGFGQAFPEWKATFNVGYSAGPVGLDLRARYIGSMENRLGAEFPGETYFGFDQPGPNVDSVIYLDAALSFDFWDDIATLRVGVNNLTDEEPQLYAPNVQSGTDPSTYDVIGRRAFAQLQFKF